MLYVCTCLWHLLKLDNVYIIVLDRNFMKYLVYSGLMASMLIGLMAASVPTQPAQARPFDICIQNPDECILVPIRLWHWPPDDGCLVCGLLDWRNILTLPDNQAFTVSVRHGPQSDQVIFDIPKAFTEGFIGPNTKNTSAMPQ